MYTTLDLFFCRSAIMKHRKHYIPGDSHLLHRCILRGSDFSLSEVLYQESSGEQDPALGQETDLLAFTPCSYDWFLVP